jgi:hypothetical protein
MTGEPAGPHRRCDSVPARRARENGVAQPSAVPAGVATTAGWSFVAEPRLAGVSVPAAFAVEVAVDAGGFQLAGRPAPASVVARLIGEARHGRDQPVLVVPHGLCPGGPAADLLYGSLADALGASVIAADAAVHVADDRTLGPAGQFRQWWPAAGLAPGAPRCTVVGALAIAAPPPPVPPAPPPEPLVPKASNPSAAGPAAAARDRDAVRIALPRPGPAGPPEPIALRGPQLRDLDPARWRAPVAGFAATPALAPVPGPVAAPAAGAWSPPPAGLPGPAGPADPAGSEAARPESEPVPTAAAPRWIGSLPWHPDDRAQLRRAIQGRYDAHARAVARTLAQQPGLLAGGSSPELMTDLVALSAYHVDDRDAVNQALRGRPGSDRELLVARGAAQGLRRLPVVLGPVYTAATPPTDYQPGEELIEPGFIDADLTRGTAAPAGVELAIWSTSARRLDSIDPGQANIALFAPGSRFLVLAVQRPPAGPLRVLLRDQADDRPVRGDLAQRLLDRMRQAVAVPADSRPGRLLPFAPGVDARGRRFTPARRAGPAGPADRRPDHERSPA